MNETHVSHERRDINVRYVGYSALIAILLIVVIQLGLHGFTTVLHPQPPIEAAATSLPPEPRLQENEIMDLVDVRQKEQAQLNSYGWIDKKEKRVHIPIDRAMEAIIQKGHPGWDGPKSENSK